MLSVVVTHRGATFPFDIDESSTVGNLAEAVAAITGVPAAAQKLVYKGAVQDDVLSPVLRGGGSSTWCLLLLQESRCSHPMRPSSSSNSSRRPRSC
eukprot:m.131528 g.131528  ORF g.131528 m.131528 type:complete len:96 (+) comp9813_c0_seq5:88-375(+)